MKKVETLCYYPLEVNGYKTAIIKLKYDNFRLEKEELAKELRPKFTDINEISFCTLNPITGIIEFYSPNKDLEKILPNLTLKKEKWVKTQVY